MLLLRAAGAAPFVINNSGGGEAFVRTSSLMRNSLESAPTRAHPSPFESLSRISNYSLGSYRWIVSWITSPESVIWFPGARARPSQAVLVLVSLRQLLEEMRSPPPPNIACPSATKTYDKRYQ